jgi:hypothetical protein
LKFGNEKKKVGNWKFGETFVFLFLIKFNVNLESAKADATLFI